MKPFLILQARPEKEAADNEFEAILKQGRLNAGDVVRVRLDCEAPPAPSRLDDYAAVIVGGGPPCVSDLPDEKPAVHKRIEEAAFSLMPAITEADFPFLGCCYGVGLLAHHLGGEVSKARYGEEVGVVDCTITEEGRKDRLLAGFPDRFTVFTGHKESAQELPPGTAHLLSSEPCPYQMFRYKTNVYATQFHPEADCESFEMRIRIYKDMGYFAPEDAGRLVNTCRNADVHVPGRILENFVNAYR